jgi:hypothetical protein
MSTPDEAAAASPSASEPPRVSVPATLRLELTPRQARLVRMALASALLVTLAAFLAVRLAERTSVLVLGVYGLAMILCGAVIELSRNGRTRLGSWLLGCCLLAALGADWLLP